MRRRIVTVIVLVSVLVSLLLVVNIAQHIYLASDTGVFKKQRNELYRKGKPEELDFFEDIFRNVVEKSTNKEIKEDFIYLWQKDTSTSVETHGMEYHVLTVDGKYLSYTIDIPDIQETSRWLYMELPIFNKKSFFSEELFYYIDGSSIKATTQ